jgi:hypothetical protein
MQCMPLNTSAVPCDAGNLAEALQQAPQPALHAESRIKAGTIIMMFCLQTLHPTRRVHAIQDGPSFGNGYV